MTSNWRRGLKLNLGHALPALLIFLVTQPSLSFEGIFLFFLFWRWFRVPDERRSTEYLLILCMPIAPLGFLIVRWTLELLTRLCPLKIDLFVFRFDALFGYPSFILRAFALSHFWFLLLITFAYDLFYASIILVIAVNLWLTTPQRTMTVLKAIGLNFLLAPLFYVLIPVAGPLYAFHDFPHIPTQVVAHLAMINAAPNGIPSLHVSTALLAFWFLKRWRWGALIGAIHVALTIVAVLATGEHYLLDVLCSIPYSAGVLTLAGWRFRNAQLSPDILTCERQTNDAMCAFRRSTRTLGI